MKTRTQFKTQKEFFKYLVENKQDIINLEKRAKIKFSDAFSLSENVANKTLATNYKDDLESGIIKRTIIGNTYNWMDSHDDVHIDDTFSKSIKERQDKIWHLHDHQQMITSKVGKPLSIYEKSVDWKDLGIDKTGKTMALFMDTNIMKEYNPFIYAQYLGKEINQHSVGMYYVQLDLAVNDNEMKAEFATFNKYINNIGNKEQVLEQGFFWAIKEAKLIEISAVLAGSNVLTPTVDNEEKTQAPEKTYWSKLAEQLAA